MKVFRPLFALVATLSLVLLGTATASATGLASSTCAGGSIAAGTYSSLTITGLCTVDSGNVVVVRDVTVAPGGGLEAVFSGSNLIVERNLVIEAGGLLAFGCSPLLGDFRCFNNPAGSTHHLVGGSIVATGAVLMIVHNDKIAGNVKETGGGGGLTCNPLFPGGPPPYTDYNGDKIGGSVTVSGLHTCWDGFLGNTVWGSVTWSNNHTVIPDGNLMGTNTVHEDLNCFHNSPKPHLSDITPVPNTVFGTARGQCAALAVGPATR
jgi:hypothetical protein